MKTQELKQQQQHQGEQNKQEEEENIYLYAYIHTAFYVYAYTYIYISIYTLMCRFSLQQARVEWITNGTSTLHIHRPLPPTRFICSSSIKRVALLPHKLLFNYVNVIQILCSFFFIYIYTYIFIPLLELEFLICAKERH